MIDLDRLSHVVAVAREGSYSAAAAAIPLSQSALTRSVQAVERDFEIQIFERGRFGARLTEKGVEFVRMAEAVLSRNAADAEALKLLGGGGDRQVRFGMGSVAAALFLPRLLPALQTLGFRYRITVESDSELRRLLRGGQIEFFTGGIPAGSDHFAAAHEFDTSKVPGGALGLLVREGHPLATGHVNESLPQFPVAAGTFLRDLDAEHLLSGLPVYGPVIEMDNYDLLARLALATDFVLISSMAFPTIRPDLGLVAVPGCEIRNLPLDWGLIWPANQQMSDTARRIVDTIYALMAEVVSAERSQSTSEG
ncbi:LysR family transcriptional regulator [Streptomyces arenae]|uniref:LysR family transcriptional regulator n=1 Tax=Streptomyces arenae TaxID=29301 RepID=UPI002658AE2B|nr:LysR family transcriptional regulator [Streptomyces arenae]MCG7207370.1 LysR family transcriptional regulator [Streptomyces arenae]